jgi:hypothetical protein
MNISRSGDTAEALPAAPPDEGPFRAEAAAAAAAAAGAPCEGRRSRGEGSIKKAFSDVPSSWKPRSSMAWRTARSLFSRSGAADALLSVANAFGGGRGSLCFFSLRRAAALSAISSARLRAAVTSTPCDGRGVVDSVCSRVMRPLRFGTRLLAQLIRHILVGAAQTSEFACVFSLFFLTFSVITLGERSARGGGRVGDGRSCRSRCMHRVTYAISIPSKRTLSVSQDCATTPPRTPASDTCSLLCPDARTTTRVAVR